MKRVVTIIRFAADLVFVMGDIFGVLCRSCYWLGSRFNGWAYGFQRRVGE